MLQHVRALSIVLILAQQFFIFATLHIVCTVTFSRAYVTANTNETERGNELRNEHASCSNVFNMHRS